MRASSVGLMNLENGRDSRHENIELGVQDSGGRPAYAESLFFRDGQKKIDFVLVYEKKDGKADTRTIYEDNLVKQHLELEKAVISPQAQVLWFYYQISDS